MPDGRMRTARCRHDHSAARTRARWALEDRKQQVRIQAEETLKTNLRTAAEVALEAASHGVVSETEANLLIESACKARAVTEGEWPIDDRRPVSPGAAERVAEASARLERALRIVREDAEDRSEMEQQALASQRRAEKKERRRARREQERNEGEAARLAVRAEDEPVEQHQVRVRDHEQPRQPSDAAERMICSAQHDDARSDTRDHHARLCAPLSSRSSTASTRSSAAYRSDGTAATAARSVDVSARLVFTFSATASCAATSLVTSKLPRHRSARYAIPA